MLGTMDFLFHFANYCIANERRGKSFDLLEHKNMGLSCFEVTGTASEFLFYESSNISATF